MSVQKVIGVIGASYSGTTVLASTLQNIPRVTAFGEAHWLVDNPDFHINVCSTCGRDCKVLKAIGFGSTDETLVSRVTQVLEGDAIVLADKGSWVYQRLMPAGEMLGVFCFKRPEAQIASMQRHGEDMSPDWYAAFNQREFYWATVFCKKLVVVNYERFCADPDSVVARISAEFELQKLTKQVTYPPPGEWHYYAGNPAAVRRTGITVDERWKVELSEKDLNDIAKCHTCQGVYKELMQHACASSASR